MLDVRFLGAPQIFLNGDPLTDLNRSPNLVRLFAFLVMHRDCPQPRAKLADLFYPDSDEEATARRNLNQLLYRLRHALRGYPCLLALSQTVQFDPHAAFRLDVTEFEGKINTEDAETISSGVALYRGEFLEGIYDDWCVPIRERLHECYLLGLSALVRIHESAGRFERALEAARLWVQADPLSDAAHYHVIELSLLMNRIDEARTQFDQYKAMRRNEFNLDASTRVLQLAYRYGLQLGEEQQTDHRVEALSAALASLIESQKDEPAQAAEIRHRLQTEIINAAVTLGDIYEERFAADEALKYYGMAITLLASDVSQHETLQRELTLRRKCDEIYDLTANRRRQLQNLTAIERLAQSLNEPRAVLDALLRRSWYEMRMDNYAASVTAAEYALAVARQCQPPDIALANRILGLANFDDGNFLRAKQCFAQALQLDEALGCVDAAVADKLNLAATDIALGEYEIALTGLESTHQGRTLPPLLQVRWQGLFGQALTKLNRLAQADAPLKAAFALSRQIGDRDLEWWLAGRVANLCFARGETNRAIHLAREYYKITAVANHASRCADLSESLAKFYICANDGNTALDWASRCAQTANAHNIWRYRMRAELRLAQAWLLLNDVVAAKVHAQQALLLYHQRNQTLEEHGELMRTCTECLDRAPLPE